MNTVWIVMPIIIALMFFLGIDLNKNGYAAFLSSLQNRETHSSLKHLSR